MNAHELSAPYVLDQLESEELAAFERILESDPELRTEVESMRSLAGVLGGAAHRCVAGGGIDRGAERSQAAVVAVAPTRPDRRLAPYGPSDRSRDRQRD